MTPRWSGDWPIPNHISLPGCRVRVKLVPPDQPPLDSAVGLHGIFRYDVDKDIATIYIDATAPLPVQRYILIHELDHVLNELRDVMLEYHLDKVHPASVRDLKEVPKCEPSSPASSS